MRNLPRRQFGQRPRYVYVASSWRNPHQPGIVALLRDAGVDCYDFREPEPGVSGFAWSDIDPEWQAWSAVDYRGALEHPIALDGFQRDFTAMERADTFVLVLPCGRSAHLELGWAVGAGKRTCILTRDGEEPELMARMVDYIATNPLELSRWLGIDRPAADENLRCVHCTHFPDEHPCRSVTCLCQRFVRPVTEVTV